jgi:hypothetical protein
MLPHGVQFISFKFSYCYSVWHCTGKQFLKCQINFDIDVSVRFIYLNVPYPTGFNLFSLNLPLLRSPVFDCKTIYIRQINFYVDISVQFIYIWHSTEFYLFGLNLTFLLSSTLDWKTFSERYINFDRDHLVRFIYLNKWLVTWFGLLCFIYSIITQFDAVLSRDFQNVKLYPTDILLWGSFTYLYIWHPTKRNSGTLFSEILSLFWYWEETSPS